MVQELSTDKLGPVFNIDQLGVNSTMDLEPIPGIIGQVRAIKSLQFGLGMKDRGFNIYVAGQPGTGRSTAVQAFLEDVAKDRPVPPDWCYVNNFKDNYRPKALKFPPGKGREFETAVRRLVDEAKDVIPKVFEGEKYTARREEMGEQVGKKREELFTALGQKAQAEGFSLQPSAMGLMIVAMKADGTPMNDQEFLSLDEKDRQALMKKREELEADLRNVSKQLRQMEREASDKLNNLDRDVAMASIGPLFSELMERYKDFPEVINYLKEVQNDMLDNIDQFTPQPEAAPSPIPPQLLREISFRKYTVNVVVDNSQHKGAPVIMEFNPNYNNLFGRIEKESQFGALITDFTLIRGGSLHAANGGYIVIHADDLLINPFSYEGLKRALGDGKISIEDPGERFGFIVTKSLMPDPIPLDAKVILVGNAYIYHSLYAVDEDFRELFKVRADFDTRMDRTSDNMKMYLGSLCRVCGQEGLRHLDSDAMRRVLEYSSRLAEEQDKLSTRFSEVADVIREANYQASLDHSDVVKGEHVKRAIEEKIYRSNLIQERIDEMIENGTIMIDTAGSVVGQLNGLSVTGMGDYSFGIPSRVTATISLGREGIVDIEREVKLGGPIHSKGVMILAGFLANKFASDKPLGLTARLVFEQSYSGVEGDSASSTELYALLSRLAEVPIKQSLAVTGSVNQRGEVQAIGGINEKIEGFFQVCKAKGLTGDNGIVMPASNVRNLVLRDEVVDAVKAGKFHIYPVKTIDEGIEVLTGVKGGERRADGTFEPGSINDRVDKRLQQMALELRDFMREEPLAIRSTNGHREPVGVQEPGENPEDE